MDGFKGAKAAGVIRREGRRGDATDPHVSRKTAMRRTSGDFTVAKRVVALTTALVVLTLGLATASEKLTRRDRDLRSTLPRLRILREGVHNISVFGEPMVTATTATAAARTWIEKYGEKLGVADLDLRAERETRLGSGGATVLAYHQYLDGLPVEGGIARVHVVDGQTFFVSYAGAKLAGRPKGGFWPDRVSDADALDVVQQSVDYGHLTQWTQPQLVIFRDEYGGPRATPVRAWKFAGFDSDATISEAYTFFVNAADGSLAHVRNEIYHQAAPDVSGLVIAIGSPETYPQSPENANVPLPVSDVWVRTDGGDLAVTGFGGGYSLDTGGLAPVTVLADLEGPWVRLRDDTSPILSLARTVSVLPATVDFLYNESATEQTTAQVNAFIHANNTHDFIKTRQPAFMDIDIQLTTQVNREANCNAFFTPIGPSLNFLSAGSGCVNSAYSTVVAHEYGHFVVDRLGLHQGAFGEGFGDAIALLMYDDPIVGRDFFGPDTNVRDIVAANQQFPCFGESHDCGQVLAGVWWDLKLEMQAALGEQDGLAFTRQLFADWVMVTVGGSIFNSAHRQTALEVLIVADDNGTLVDGVPYEAQICSAFAAHNISCPDVCAEVRRVRATCRSDGSGDYNVRATFSSSSVGGAEVRATLNGESEQLLGVGRFGRTTAHWDGVDAGTYEVCAEGCNVICDNVICEP